MTDFQKIVLRFKCPFVFFQIFVLNFALKFFFSLTHEVRVKITLSCRIEYQMVYQLHKMAQNDNQIMLAALNIVLFIFESFWKQFSMPFMPPIKRMIPIILQIDISEPRK